MSAPQRQGSPKSNDWLGAHVFGVSSVQHAADNRGRLPRL